MFPNTGDVIKKEYLDHFLSSIQRIDLSYPLGDCIMKRVFSGENEHAEEVWRMIETGFRSLFDAMAEGVAINELLYDNSGNPVEYRIIDVNPTFETHTGILASQAKGALSCAL